MSKPNEFTVKVKSGCFCVTECGDIDYPGIDIEFVANNDNGDNLSRPRVLFECPVDGNLRVLIWDDKDNEDFTREIKFDI